MGKNVSNMLNQFGRTFTYALIIVLLSSFTLCWVTEVSAAQQDKYVLKFVSAYPSLHPSISNGIEPWIKKIKEKSNGRLIIQFYAPGTLTPAKEHWEAVRTGIADIGFNPNGFSAGTFPLQDVVALPFMFQSAEAASLSYWELCNQFPEMKAEFDGVKLLWLHTGALYQLHTSKKKVTTLDDIRGMKTIVWTVYGRKYAAMLGAVPQEMVGMDSYPAMQRGMAEGIFCPIAPMRSFKVDEVTKYHTNINFTQDPFWGGMNIKTFEELPADLQKLIVETAGKQMASTFGKTLDQGDLAGIKYMEGKGHKFYTLPAEEIEKWRAKVSPIYEEWISDMEKRGYTNARKIFETARELGVKYQNEINAR